MKSLKFLLILAFFINSNIKSEIKVYKALSVVGLSTSIVFMPHILKKFYYKLSDYRKYDCNNDRKATLKYLLLGSMNTALGIVSYKLFKKS